MATMEALINNALQDKNAELTTDEQGNLLLMSKDGSNVFGSNHVQLTPQSFLDQSFAPILKVATTPAAQQQRQSAPAAATPAAGGEDVSVTGIKSHTERVLAEMNMPKSSLM